MDNLERIPRCNAGRLTTDMTAVEGDWICYEAKSSQAQYFLEYVYAWMAIHISHRDTYTLCILFEYKEQAMFGVT